MSEEASLQSIIDSALDRLKKGLGAQFKKAEIHAENLFKIALRRFDKVANEIGAALHGVVTNYNVFASSASSEDQRRSQFYRYQIIDTAKKLDYYANLRDYSSWVRLTICVYDI